MKKLICFFAIILPASLMIAQNNLYVEPVQDLKKNADLDRIVPTYITDFFDPNNYFSGAFSSFTRGHIDFMDFTFQYSFFNYPSSGVGELSDFKNSDGADFDFEKNYQKLRELFFKDKSFFEPLYKILMPLYQQAFSKMTSSENEAVLKTLELVMKYTENFDLTTETSEEKSYPNDFAYSRTKVCAFVYRRIRNNELTQTECLNWLKRIYNDLKSSVKPKKGFEDYILVSKEFGEIYKGVKLYYDYENIKYFAKENDKYTPLDSNQIFFEHQCYQQKSKDGQFKLTFFIFENETEKSFEVKNPKETKSILNLYDYILFVYTDDSAELMLKENHNKREKFSSKLKDEPIWIGNVVLLNYQDGKSVLIRFSENGDQYELTDMDKNISYLTFYEQYNFYFAKSENGEKLLLKNIENTNRISIIKLPSKFDYTDFYIWRDYLIFRDGTNSKVGFLSKNYEELIQPEFSSFVIPSDDSEFILLSDKQNELVYGMYDLNLKRMGKNTFVPVYSTQYFNADTDFDYSLMDNKDNTIILLSFQPDARKEHYVLADKSGKFLIPEKWPYIMKINLISEDNNVYAVCNKIKINVETVEYTGKWALFNHKGKQLTKFIYDSINEYADENGLIRCRKGKLENIYLDKEGKVVKSGN